MPLNVSSIFAHHREVKIALHNLWYHHTYRWPSRTQVERGLVMQFWPPDDEHMCSKHVEAWNKLIVKQTFCASIWLITEINILRCTVSKRSKNVCHMSLFFYVRSHNFNYQYRGTCPRYFTGVCQHQQIIRVLRPAGTRGLYRLADPSTA